MLLASVRGREKERGERDEQNYYRTMEHTYLGGLINIREINLLGPTY